ncbi:hypothetical protein B0F90DRAFT_1688642 [Multifurca ochricompacta]|uniref:Uncharacterized protein n=1 Tax=Multifurca ochricompacta TaxID=376703 RepID=A0AAD4QRT5_9AGAM|nr:hypothetical protein B0F90DRAFT_1688642 [Multifurca ochricompacta]
MPRELRPHKAHQSYLEEDDNEQEPGPSQPQDKHHDGRLDNNTGSDFAPPAFDRAALADQGGSEYGAGRRVSLGKDAGVQDFSSSGGNSSTQLSRKKKKTKDMIQRRGKSKTKVEGAKGKGKEKTEVPISESPAPIPMLRPTARALSAPTRQNYALPNPNMHHRHRPVPLFPHQTAAAPRVERLLHPPLLFAPDECSPTHGYASMPAVTSRVGKAWGASIGAGPVWQIVEDLGWYKESEKVTAQEGQKKAAQVQVCEERGRRPRVHAGVVIPEGSVVLLSAEVRFAYLPTDSSGPTGLDTAASASATPAPTVSCDFGPFGRQTNIKLETLDAQQLSQFLPESCAHVFNAGAPAWGLDWCPIHPDDRPHCSYKYYLAAAPFPSRTHSPEIGVKVARPQRACVQLWTLVPSSDTDRTDDDRGEMQCEMVLCIDSGPALELKWCPLPSHDPLAGPSQAFPRKLGLLAGVFEDGSLSVYVVPYPPDLAPTQHSPTTDPVYVKINEPILRIELEEAAFCTLDWGNSELIAAGLANGVIVVYNIGRALQSPSEPILPMGYFCVHQSAIRALTWVRVPDMHGKGPTVIASGGYDGLQCLTDIRELGGHVFNRTRDAINSITYSPYLSAVVTIDHENTIKSYSVSPSTLGRGHALMDPGGPVWSLSASDYHPQLAVGAADGICYTTNGLRATRRGGFVPSLVHRVYQLDYSRTEGRFRMLDRLKPREMAERPEGGGGAWDASVGVQRVAWHSGAGLAAAGLLASATGSGLCRVDFLKGRWFRDRVPYERIEAMRLEEENAMEVDELEDNDDSS